MAKDNDAFHTLLACGRFGVACGAAVGVTVGFVSMLILGLPFLARIDFSRGLFFLLLLVSLGIGYGCCLGAVGGLMAGTVGGSFGGVGGWALGGLFGGHMAGLIPAAWVPWPVETIGALLGLVVGAAVGVGIAAGDSASRSMARLIAAVERSELNVWPLWQRRALGVALLGVWHVVGLSLYRWFSTAPLPGANLLPWL